MRFRDIRDGADAPDALKAKTTFRFLSPIGPPPGRPMWFGARAQMLKDAQRQQPKRSRRQRLSRKPRVGRWS